MLISDLDKNILKNGFLMPRFTDGIRVIWYGELETFYRFILFVFYLLGCFQVRFYQYNVKQYNINPPNFWIDCETKRLVSFHSIDWNPISILADFIFQIMNCFYTKELIEIEVSSKITIDVTNNRAYIIHIRK